MNKIKSLEEKIAQAQEAYYNGSAIISDDEYDALIYELSCLNANHPLLTKIGNQPVEEWEKAKHLVELGSLNKVNAASELSKWMQENLQNNSVVVSEKLDGLSIGCQYENGKLVKAVLRGNGLEGENILVNVLKMQGVITKIKNFTGTIRGEIVLTKENQQKYFQDYANPRNAASGLCRRLDGEGCQHLNLIFYQVIGEKDFNTERDQLQFLEKCGFQVPNYKYCQTAQQVIDLWQSYQDKIRAQLNYEIDGLVVACDDVIFGQSLGATNMRPKAKMAFKFANQFVSTTVKNISWEVGNSGRITPVCWFEPVNLLGSTVKKASVYNLAYVEKLGLNVGAKVLICKANEIIPRVEKVIKSTGGKVNTPKKCPACQHPLQMLGEYLICPNGDGCQPQVEGRIKNWIKELNLLEWGEVLIQKLVQCGRVKTPADLYTLTPDELSNLDRMGDKSAAKCYDILWSNNKISLDILLGALSIPLIGSNTVKLIMDAGYDTLDKCKGVKLSDLDQITGIGPTKAKAFILGLENNQKLITQLLENGIEIKEPIRGKLSSYSICFTGTMINKRATLEKMATEAGALIKTSVGKNLSYLVIADVNSNSSKAQMARKLGTKLISEQEFLQIVNYH